nr:unnamed protein product [Callosobruchus analis]
MLFIVPLYFYGLTAKECRQIALQATVDKPQKVIALIGKKGVAKVTSPERGTLVTTCCHESSSGNTLPPAMGFQRKIFKDHMIKNTLPGTF